MKRLALVEMTVTFERAMEFLAESIHHYARPIGYRGAANKFYSMRGKNNDILEFHNGLKGITCQYGKSAPITERDKTNAWDIFNYGGKS